MKSTVTMKPTSSENTTLSPGPLVLLGLILAAALTRLLPTPPNVSPVEAMALFGGAYFAARWLSFAVPLVAMLVADLALAAIFGGLYSSHLFGTGFFLVYACIAGMTLMGFALRGRVTGPRVLGLALASTLGFFLVTNFAAWLGSPLYPQTLAGLGASYVAGLPFLKWSMLSTLFYAAVLFGGFELLRRRIPVLRAQTV